MIDMAEPEPRLPPRENRRDWKQECVKRDATIAEKEAEMRDKIERAKSEGQRRVEKTKERLQAVHKKTEGTLKEKFKTAEAEVAEWRAKCKLLEVENVRLKAEVESLREQVGCLEAVNV